jgi:hypothetical protein
MPDVKTLLLLGRWDVHLFVEEGEDSAVDFAIPELRRDDGGSMCWTQPGLE